MWRATSEHPAHPSSVFQTSTRRSAGTDTQPSACTNDAARAPGSMICGAVFSRASKSQSEMDPWGYGTPQFVALIVQ